MDIIKTILNSISLSNLNILLLLGISIFGGTIGGRLFKKIKIPQVVGYIILGIIIGESGFKLIHAETITTFQPFSYFALGLIGFMVGGELKINSFKKYGRQFTYILFFEAFGAFIFVSSLIGLIGIFILKDVKLSIVFALLLGSISSATAAAGTTDVLWEYKTKGPLTTTLLGVVALDDILALFLFAISASISGTLLGNSHNNLLMEIWNPIYEIGFAIIIGTGSGFILATLLKRYSDEEKTLTFTIGSILFVLGLSIALNVDMILSSMVMGIIITNFAPNRSKNVFKILDKIGPPIYVLFFVLVGAKLNFGKMNLFFYILAGLYLAGRTAGKMIGTNLGAKISGAVLSIKKYLPLCLFSQSGVAIGLSIVASQKFPNDVGNAIIIVITTTTFIVQIIGPIFTKIAVVKANETGLNITEEDLIKMSKASDILDKNVPFINENMNLEQVLLIFSEYENLHFPVINKEQQLIGIISIDNVKNTFMASELTNLILAHDIMEPVIATCKPETSMSEVNETLKKLQLEYLPVITDDNILHGIIEKRSIDKLISKKILELQHKTEALG